MHLVRPAGDHCCLGDGHNRRLFINGVDGWSGVWEDEWIHTGQSGLCDYTLIEVNSCCLCVCVWKHLFLEAFTQQGSDEKMKQNTRLQLFPIQFIRTGIESLATRVYYHIVDT